MYILDQKASSVQGLTATEGPLAGILKGKGRPPMQNNWILVICWWGCKMVQPLQKTVRSFLIKLSYDPVIPLLGIHPPKIESMVLKRYLHTYVHNSIIHNRQRSRSNPRPATNEWKNKMWSIHTIKYFYSTLKKEENSYTTWMSLEDIKLSDIGQSQKDKYCMMLLR